MTAPNPLDEIAALLDELIDCVMEDKLVLHATPGGQPHDPDPRIRKLRDRILALKSMTARVDNGYDWEDYIDLARYELIEAWCAKNMQAVEALCEGRAGVVAVTERRTRRGSGLDIVVVPAGNFAIEKSSKKLLVFALDKHAPSSIPDTEDTERLDTPAMEVY